MMPARIEFDMPYLKRVYCLTPSWSGRYNPTSATVIIPVRPTRATVLVALKNWAYW
jgi:hypothetical protein